MGRRVPEEDGAVRKAHQGYQGSWASRAAQQAMVAPTAALPLRSSALLPLLLLLLLLPSSNSFTNVTIASCPKPDDPGHKPDDDPGHGGMFNCTDMPPRAPIPALRRPPVMLVPSMLGSFLQRKLHNSHEPYPICPNGVGWLGGADWRDMWPPYGLEPDCKSMTCLPTDLYPVSYTHLTLPTICSV